MDRTEAPQRNSTILLGSKGGDVCAADVEMQLGGGLEEVRDYINLLGVVWVVM